MSRRSARAQVAIYDPALFRKALDDDYDDGGYLGPEDERPVRPPISRHVEGEIWARCLQRILDDPRGHTRPALQGTHGMARRLLAATATMGHFAAVTGVVERAIVQSARTGRPVRFPPILMVSPSGLGKTFYCRTLAAAMATTSVPIAINASNGWLGGLAPAWRGAKIGRIAEGLLIDSATAAPLYLLDELDKPPLAPGGPGENIFDCLLSALEPENAMGFVDQYLEVPIALDSALWLASANDVRAIPEPLLSRMLVVDVPRPTPAQALPMVQAIAAPVLLQSKLKSVSDEAVAALLDLGARQSRQALEIAAGFAVYGRRDAIALADVRRALALVERRDRRPMGFTAGLGVR